MIIIIMILECVLLCINFIRYLSEQFWNICTKYRLRARVRIFHFYGTYWLEFVCVQCPLDPQPKRLKPTIKGRQRNSCRGIKANTLSNVKRIICIRVCYMFYYGDVLYTFLDCGYTV